MSVSSISSSRFRSFCFRITSVPPLWCEHSPSLVGIKIVTWAHLPSTYGLWPRNFGSPVIQHISSAGGIFVATPTVPTQPSCHFTVMNHKKPTGSIWIITAGMVWIEGNLRWNQKMERLRHCPKKQNVWIAEMAHFSRILSATYFGPCATHEQLLIPIQESYL